MARRRMAWKNTSESFFSASRVRDKEGPSAPRGGSKCPGSLLQVALAQGLRPVDTVTNGDCGLDAFIRSAQALDPPRKKCWTDLANAADLRKHCRLQMVAFLRKNAAVEIWEGVCLRDIALAAQSNARRYQDWLCQLSEAGTWLDTAAMLGLAASFNVDVVILQADQGPCIVGASLLNLASDMMVPVLLVNDYHFWAVAQENADDHDVSKASHIDKGDRIHIPTAVRRKLPKASKDADDPDDDNLEDGSGPGPGLSSTASSARVDADLSLCEALIAWDPFCVPSETVLAALGRLSATAGGNHVTSWEECQGRQMAIAQLQLENSGIEAGATRKISA